jgi:alkylation response protein AidB-like acyl-CoA dehydrogenase
VSRRPAQHGGGGLDTFGMSVLLEEMAVQVHGGYGVSKEFPLERWYREARVRRIGEGPSEVHRMVIARSLIR